jgi:multidrug resistance efflux pump
MLATQQSTQTDPRDQLQSSALELLDKAQFMEQGLEFGNALLQARTLDEVYLLLTNDIRCMINFDRSFLVTHLGGSSGLVAAGTALTPEKKSRFYRQLSHLAPHLVGHNRTLLVSRSHIDQLTEAGVEQDLAQALKSFLEFSGAHYFFCLPLHCNGNAVAHLLFEFLDNNLPEKNSLLTLDKMQPVLAAALVQKWLIHTKPAVAALVSTEAQSGKTRWQRAIHKARFAAPAIAIVLLVLFVIPFEHTVGGDAEVVPQKRHMAFSQMEGLIDKVYVREGSEVHQGAILATLDPRELTFRINVAQRELDILFREMSMLRDSAGNHPSKLAQAELVELNRRKKQKELEYLQSRQAFLEIKAPVSGTVITKNIQTLAGKHLGAGEPFSEISVRDELCVDVNVPDDRMTLVKPGQEVWMYLNSDPAHGHKLAIKEIAPRAEALPRFGNIFRARAEFTDAPPSTMVGMKGIGKIRIGTASLWSIISHKLHTRWNELAASLS